MEGEVTTGSIADSVIDEQPSSVSADATEATPDSEDSTEQNKAVSKDEKPDENQSNKSKEYNFKKLREKIRAQEERLSELKGAQDLERWLKTDPKNMKFLMDLMRGAVKIPGDEPVKTDPAPEQDPFNDLIDPEIAKELRQARKTREELEDLKKWRAEQEEREKQNQRNSIQKNMSDADSEFVGLLQKDGFFDAEKGAVDQDLLEVLEASTARKLAVITDGNPHLASKEEVRQAYEAAKRGLSAHQKIVLKKTVRKDIPVSGSAQGMVPTGKNTMTASDRKNRLISALD